MIKNVIVRLGGTRADDARPVTTDQIAEYFGARSTRMRSLSS